MIRWYDYPAAFLFADLMMTAAFSIPWIGLVVAYAMYEYGWDYYCQYRLAMEQ
jgi:hypothetical protein